MIFPCFVNNNIFICSVKCICLLYYVSYIQNGYHYQYNNYTISSTITHTIILYIVYCYYKYTNNILMYCYYIINLCKLLDGMFAASGVPLDKFVQVLIN